MFPEKAAAPRSPKIKRVIFCKHRQNPRKTTGKDLIPSKTAGPESATLPKEKKMTTPRSGSFCNTKIVKMNERICIHTQ